MGVDAVVRGALPDEQQVLGDGAQPDQDVRVLRRAALRECAKQLLERFPGARVINTYGPAEATVFVTSVEIDAQVLSQPGPLPLGRVKPDCEIVIVDPGGSRVQDGAKGEIIIIGPSVSPGYYRGSDRTGRFFYDAANGRAYRTGDA